MFPKLRFKEFDENWKEVTLKNCITSIDSGWSPQCESYPANSSEWGVLKTTSVDWSGFNSSFNKKLPLELTPRKEIEVKPLDILVTRAGPTERVGVVSVVPHSVRSKLMISDKLIRLKSNEENNPLFLGISLSSVKCQNQLQSKTSGLAKSQTNISQKILGEVLLKLPSKEEQTKIATFLSAVDEKISQLTQKHQLLREYKQGMMQKLFSQQVRFKADDGSEFGEWENKTLSKFIIKHIGGASLKPSDFVEQSEYEVIPKKAIVPNGYLNLDKDNPTYCSEDFFKANLKNTVDNTYLVTVLRDLVPSGPSIGYIVKYMENTQYILAQGVYGFKLKEELNKDFLIHYSNTKAYRLVMQSIMVGSTQVHIRNQDFFGIEIPVPCLAEQTKIANFLSAIDQKIEVVAQQIEQAKTWKKGLLQQMFV